MLNERAQAILEFIQSFHSEKGFPPTIREIGKQFHISSTNGVRYYLALLERNGQLKRRPRISRGLGTAMVVPSGIRILGRVAAGQPINAEEHYEGSIEPAQAFGDARELFALKVRGDSMTGAGILDGDYVVVRHQSRAEPGDMIVALIGDEATVKYYRPLPDKIELVAANPAYQPITVESGEDFRVAGVVRGVMRTVGR